MGTLRFRIPEHVQYDQRFWQSAYVSTAIEGIPKPSSNRLEDGVLNIDYDAEDTCKLSMPWPTKDYGPVVLTSTSLKASQIPYSLPLELARGTIHRIRTRAFDWDHIQGLRIPSSYKDLMEEALDIFVQAVVEESLSGSSGYQAQLSIDKAIEASRSLARAYTSQVLQLRSQAGEKLQTLFGVQLPIARHWKDAAEALLPACNSVSVDLGIDRIPLGANRLSDDDMAFDQLDWARQHDLKVIGGPLISLQQGRTPSFFDASQSFEQLYKLVCTRVANVVSQVAGRVKLWDASSSFNCCEQFRLNDEQAFRLASGVIGAIRSVDKGPIIFSINFPAAEYMARPSNSVHECIDPFRFARSLIQVHDRDIVGIGLNLNLNSWPYGTLPRDLIDISDLIDHWQYLEKSLLVRLSAPLSIDPDPLARFDDSLVSKWTYPCSRRVSHVIDANQDTDPDLFGTAIESDSQVALAGRSDALPPNGLELLQMLLAKPSVHGLIWNQATDSVDHLFPNTGLFDQRQNRRPLIDCMARLREQYII
jgi:hypothetical protein